MPIVSLDATRLCVILVSYSLAAFAQRYRRRAITSAAWCGGASVLAVDEQASHGSDEALCAPGDGGQLHQPMWQRETACLMVQLFFGDRPPQSIDDCGRIVVDLPARGGGAFCPQRGRVERG